MKGLDQLISENSREETDRSTMVIMGGDERRGDMYTVMKDGVAIGYFDTVKVLPNGILSCQSGKHDPQRETYFSPGNWDVVFSGENEIETQWGVRISTADHPQVILMAKDRHDAVTIQSNNSGELVSRLCGPWEPKA